MVELVAMVSQAARKAVAATAMIAAARRKNVRGGFAASVVMFPLFTKLFVGPGRAVFP